MFVRLGAIFVIGIFSTAAACVAGEPTRITLSEPRAVMATPTLGAAFGTISTSEKDKLLSVSSDCCNAVEIHQSGMVNGTMSMRAVSNIAITPQKPIVLMQHAKAKTPTSMHLMLIGAKEPLEVGQTVDITLHFAKAGAVTHAFPVEALGAR